MTPDSPEMPSGREPSPETTPPDPDGDALLDMLSKERPLAREDIPDPFADSGQSGQFAKPGQAGPSVLSDQARPAQPTQSSGAKDWQVTQRQEAARAPGHAGNSRWGRGEASDPSGGDPSPPGGSGGAWVWLPEGLQTRKAWRKRHPVLFWGGVLVALLLVFGWGRMSAEKGPLGGPKIAVINLEGVILDPADTLQWIERIRTDESVKGAVLRVNSPGGAVGPSQEVYAAIKRLDAAKPVVASMGAVAASGGYYAALGAREIYAGPSTLTASIGVKMQVPNLAELMKTVGITEKTLTTGKLKDAGSTSRSMTPEEEAYFRALLGDMYEEFIRTVAKERNIPLDGVRSLADGRAMTGRQALEARLVDKLGDRQDAVSRVRRLSDLPDGVTVRIVEGPEKPSSTLRELMSSLLEAAMERQAAAERPVFMY